MRVPLVGPAYETKATDQNAQRCVNWFVEGTDLDKKGGKFPSVLYPTPGLVSFGTIGSGIGSVRQLHVHKDVLYAVADNKFYSVDSSGTETELGTLGSSSGRVTIASINEQIVIVDGTNGYIYIVPSNTFKQITDSDFPSDVESVASLDGYFIVTSAASARFYVSALLDGETWTATGFASAEAVPDNLVGVTSNQRELWLFGTDTTEVWFNSGNVDFPFEKRPGVLVEKGCVAEQTIARIEDSLYWLASDRSGQGQIVSSVGYRTQIISTSAIEQQIASYSTISDAFSYAYYQDGHHFYVITFPTAKATWVYDITTGLWHERDSIDGGESTRHRSNCYAFVYDKNIVGDFNSGNLYYFDVNTYTDNGTTIKRVRTTSNFNNESDMISVYNFVVEFETGVGLASGQGSDPEVMLRVSRDGGHTWGNEMWRKIGALGEYNKKALWTRLGQARTWTLELSVTDPVKWVVLGAYADVEGVTR